MRSITRLAPTRRRARRLALVAVTAAGVAAPAPAAVAVPGASAGAAPRTASPIVSPTPGQRVTRHRLKVVVRAGDEHGDLSVTLNGRRVGRDFAPGKHGLRALRVASSHGLRHGRNVLRVRARRGYIVRRETVQFTVKRRGPLVGAGRDRPVTAGEHTRLRGHVDRAPGGRPAGKVRWRVLRAPRGSRVRRIATPEAGKRQARAAAAGPAALPRSALRPLLKPDAVGTYRLQLKVGSGASAAVDTVEYSAVAADPLVPIDMQVAPASSATGEAQPGIRVGAATYRAPYLGYQHIRDGTGAYEFSHECCLDHRFVALWQVVALHPFTLEVLYNRTYGLCGIGQRFCRSPDNPQAGRPYDPVMGIDPAGELLRAMPVNGGPGALILGRRLRNTTAPRGADDYTGVFGGVGVANYRDLRPQASFVGVPGMTPGEADVSAREDGRLPGFLTSDQHGRYHYLSSFRPQFDTRRTATCDATTCTIGHMFGGDYVAATVPRGHGGYLISGWDPVTLGVRKSTFARIDADDESSLVDETRSMAATLSGFEDEGFIVAITTVRTPGMPAGSTLVGAPTLPPPSGYPVWDDITQTIASLGGTKNGFLRSVSDPSSEYTMVGWAGAGEGGGYEAAGTSEAARLRGALVPNRQSLLRPANVSSVGAAAERINQMMVRPTSSAWKHPDAGTGPGVVIRCIGAALRGEPDIRGAYTTLRTQAQAMRLQNDVKGLTRAQLGAVSGTGLTCAPTAADFTTGRDQLVRELGWVGNVRGYLEQLSTPKPANNGTVWGQTLTLGQQLQQALSEGDPEQQVTASSLGFVASLRTLTAPGIGTSIGGAENITPAVKTAAGLFVLASEGIVRASDGGPELDSNVRAAALAGHLQQKAQAATAAFTQIGDVLVSDPTKLAEVGKLAGCTNCPPDFEEYAAGDADIADLTNVSLRAMGRSLYQTLVTRTYPTWDTGITQYPDDPYAHFYCQGTFSPFGKVPPSAYSSSLDRLNRGAPTMSRVYLMIGSGATWRWAPKAITDRMFGPTGDTWDEGGLGMDPLTVMRNSPGRFTPSATYSCSFHE